MARFRGIRSCDREGRRRAGGGIASGATYNQAQHPQSLKPFSVLDNFLPIPTLRQDHSVETVQCLSHFITSPLDSYSVIL